MRAARRASRTPRPARMDHAPRTPHSTPAGRIRLLGLLLVSACALVYANSLGGPFLLDDHDSIVNNATLTDWKDIPRLFAQPRNTPLAGRPLVAFTFAVNRATSGLAVRAYHLTNILLHALCALLLFAIVRRTLTYVPATRTWRPADGGGGPESIAFAVALLWAVHPLNTEVLNYMTERTEGLMSLCLLASLYAAILGATHKWKAAWQVAAVAACGLGMLCKENMVVAPVVIVLYDRIFLFDSLRAALAARWRMYGGLALTWLALLYMMASGPRSNSVGFDVAATPWNYLLNQAVMVARYVRLAVWPHGLVVNYGPPVAHRLAEVSPHAAFVILLLAVSIAALRWSPATGFLGAWFFIILAPTSSIIPIATEVGAERRMYLPLMAIAALVAVPAMRTLGRRVSPGFATVVLVVAAVALGTVTFQRNRDYATPLSLAESTLRHWPTDVAHGMVGSALAALHRDSDAISQLRLAARTDARSRYNLAIELYNLKRFDEATAEFARFAGENSQNELVPSARRILGDIFAQQRKWPEAIKEYRLALSMYDDTDTRRKMTAAMSMQALALVEAGRVGDAAALFRRAVEWDPTSWRTHYNLATALLDNHEAAAAEGEARAALRIDPKSAESYALLGRTLAIQGHYDDAVAQFREALELAPGDAQIEDDLRRVLAVTHH
jgi:protein O-mannosyl-transferase